MTAVKNTTSNLPLDLTTKCLLRERSRTQFSQLKVPIDLVSDDRVKISVDFCRSNHQKALSVCLRICGNASSSRQVGSAQSSSERRIDPKVGPSESRSFGRRWCRLSSGAKIGPMSVASLTLERTRNSLLESSRSTS